MGPFGRIVWSALGVLSLPSALWLLLVAAGAAAPRFLPALSDRWTALTSGEFLGAFGVWCSPVCVRSIFGCLSVPEEDVESALDIAFNAWVTSAALIGLSAYAAWSMRGRIPTIGPRELGDAVLGAIFVFIGTGSRMWASNSERLRQREFGRRSFEPSVIVCAPGGEAVATLKLEKAAKSVEAQLEMDSGDDGPDKTAAARVGTAMQTPEGWLYRVTAIVPGVPPSTAGGGWVLSVKALGRDGGEYIDAATIELTGST